VKSTQERLFISCLCSRNVKYVLRQRRNVPVRLLGLPAAPFSSRRLVVQTLSQLIPLPPPDKTFEDDESVDGGRSSSSSKGASLSGRKAVSMGSFRRPASASSSKSAGQNRGRRLTQSLSVQVSTFLRSALCAGRDGSAAGAVDEEDFIQAFEDVPTVQVGSRHHSRHLTQLSHLHMH